MVFSDPSLHEMASIFPRTAESMLAVSGVGEVKLERYGRRFIRLIERYCTDHPERAA
jgi:ATP-dependent DNA helicase RecQ